MAPTISVLLDGGVTLDAKLQAEQSPLWLAVKGHHASALETLLERMVKADLPIGEKEMNSLLNHAFRHGRTSPTIANILLRHGVENTVYRDKLHEIVRPDLLDTLKHRADKSFLRGRLHEIVRRGHLDTLKLALDRMGDENYINILEDSKTVMHMALSSKRDKSSSVEMISILLQHGADPNIADSAGCTPLHIAVSLRNLRACQALVEHRASVIARLKKTQVWVLDKTTRVHRIFQDREFYLILEREEDFWISTSTSGNHQDTHWNNRRGPKQQVPTKMVGSDWEYPTAVDLAHLISGESELIELLESVKAKELPVADTKL